jgi:ABC-type multidrug transport system fused ATPase/permease subunit
LLLDEATSALDSQSERLVQDALDRVSLTRTTVTIAHRLSTIKNADKIVCMFQGEIVEQGTHNELVANKGMYAKLVHAQQLNNEVTGKVTNNNYLEHAISTESEVAKEQTQNDLEAGIGKKRRTLSVMYEIMKLNRPELKYSIPALIAAIIAGLINPFFAISFAEIVQAFSKKGIELEQETNKWAISFVIIAIVGFTATFFQNTLFGFASELLTERIRKSMFTTILRQDIGFFDREDNSTGVLTSNLATDAQKVQGVSGAIIGTMCQIITNLLGSIIISLIFGWKLGLVATAVLPLLVFTGIMRMKIITYFSDMNKVAYQKSAQQACEAVAAVRTVQSLTREKAVLDTYSRTLKTPYENGVKNAFTNTSIYALSQSINFLINALVFWYGGYLMAYESYSTKQFFTVFVAIIFGSQGVGRIFAYAPDFVKAAEAGQNIIRLLETAPQIDSNSTGGERLELINGHIEFKNVSFRYPHRPHLTVLKDLSITIKPGQFCAIVGPSGCGKSTTIGLLERFYDPDSGSILLDGKDISKLNVSNYRNLIGLVSQEPTLFAMSVKENIVFGCVVAPSEEDIVKAAKEANIHEFIMSLPDQYETFVGSKGSQMSGMKD